tara:strand:+ start:258 stop:1247 length:990 start_codon:yes stop_codon:yes gene_type:complete
MEKKPFHHLSDGTFRNPEGSPERDKNIKWSYRKFNAERKKIEINYPKDHIVPRNEVLKNLEENKNEDYVAWIGHATFLIKLGNTTIITDPLFSDHTGPFGMFGPKRYIEPAIKLNEVPKTDLLILSHDHYDHLDLPSIKNFPHKKTKVIVPLKMSKYFNSFNDVNELDWYDEIMVNKDIKVTLLPAVHWGKRTLWDTNKKLWANFLIEHKGKKILFCSDTGFGEIYKELGSKYGPIDLTLINIGAYDFKKMGIEKSIYHTTPEEALQVARDLKSKKIIGMHWGTVVLSLEPIMEPPKRFKDGAKKFGYSKDDAIIFKIGELKKFKAITN